MTEKLVIEFTRKQALTLDLLWCSCGHRPNNHFPFGLKPCAHCDCRFYEEQVHGGTLIERKKE